jgi:hypothetical protein
MAHRRDPGDAWNPQHPFFDKKRTKLGVKPGGVPPVYEPETVADIILYAAEHPARDLVSGGAA